jgi:hypothetical protein
MDSMRHVLINFANLAELLDLDGEVTQVWVENGTHPPYLHIMFKMNDDSGFATPYGASVETSMLKKKVD